MILDPIGAGRFILADDRVMGWVAAHIPGVNPEYRWQHARALGLVSGGAIIAGMVVHDYCADYRSCQITFAASTARWATRASIRAFLRYPFEQLGCERITTLTSEHNTRALRFNAGIGFQREGVMRRGCGDADCIVFGLLKSETPSWLHFTSEQK